MHLLHTVWEINTSIVEIENNIADITHHMSVFVKGNDAGTIQSATLEIKSKNISKTYTLFYMKNHC